MNQPDIDYNAVLADMEAKRDALTSAIDNMRRWLGGTSATGTSQRQNSGDIPSDAFFGLGILEAIKKYLAMSKGKRTTNEVVQALEKGGVTHSSKNFRNTVSTTLYREAEKPNGDIARVGEGEWGLVDWYSGLRARRQKMPTYVGSPRSLEEMSATAPEVERVEREEAAISEDEDLKR